MSPTRRSANLERYRQRQAREELEGPFGWLLAWWYLALGAVVVLVWGASQLPAPRGWLLLGSALALGCVALGMRRHAEWARWGGCALFGGSAVAGLFLAVIPSWREDPIPRHTTQMLVNAAAAVYLALPATGRRFREARGEPAGE